MSLSARVQQGTLVLRRWSGEDGLSEFTRPFASLDELLAICLEVGNPDLIDRIVIRGTDEHGTDRVLSFSFRSLNVEIGIGN